MAQIVDQTAQASGAAALAGLGRCSPGALVASGIVLLAAHSVAVLNSPDREPRSDEPHLPGETEARRRPKPHRRDE